MFPDGSFDGGASLQISHAVPSGDLAERTNQFPGPHLSKYDHRVSRPTYSIGGGQSTGTGAFRPLQAWRHIDDSPLVSLSNSHPLADVDSRRVWREPRARRASPVDVKSRLWTLSSLGRRLVNRAYLQNEFSEDHIVKILEGNSTNGPDWA
ncbi:hypothetical protein N7539_005924 [Penicillium diatomitis]|uniref:Uncharacterized protein n=1 Tax=Penicillium diatomitis TaxID=2819901 RepID=A0A9W9X590_9EURO|nr:uncharacterized protein N7539_005924 [Penicillium diatomitis]KAJ5484128.1 hypothetical protein N7539_005924 [Penicillium diatomitis]